jgi:hypothetical protein
VTVNSAEPVDDPDGGFTARIAGALGVLAGQLVDFTDWRAAAATRPAAR